MPELPEVTTTVAALAKTIVGHQLTDVLVVGDSAKLLRSGVNVTKQALLGHTITNVWRRAKNVVVDLSGGVSAVIHMRMSGHLLVANRRLQVTPDGRWQGKGSVGNWEPVTGDSPFADPKNQFIRILFILSGDKQLALSDLRKFATLDVHPSTKLKAYFDAKYGPEPLEPDFTPKRFNQMLVSKRRAIKPLLMDQAFLSGVGNIYADEALWTARIHPLTPAHHLTSVQTQALHAAIRGVLTKGIDLGGTSIDDYRMPDGSKGRYGEVRKAYGRGGQSCPRCGTTLKRIVVGQRGTTFCPKCQPSMRGH